MSWPELGASATFALEDEQNPELCGSFWAALPFECLQEHGMVTGDIIYCWTPLVNLDPVHFSQLHTASPIGRVSYSQGTGNKVIVKYGPCSEDLAAPCLGMVGERDHAVLRNVGEAIWHNTMAPKDLLRVRFEQVRED
jgi:hypothetical protein